MGQRIQLVVGLGNPGAEYATTRHNAGARLVRELAAGVPFKSERRFRGMVAQLSTPTKVRLLLPEVWMNESGLAVRAITDYYRLVPEHILVVHDELDLPAGEVRLKWGGGSGGHNGLRSIISLLGSNAFARLRLGIGHPGQRERVTPWVLSTAPSSQRTLCEQAQHRALSALQVLFEGDEQRAMKLLHSSHQSIGQRDLSAAAVRGE